MKEIPNTKLLVSLNCSYRSFVNMQIFDVSKRERANKIYSFVVEGDGNNFIFPLIESMRLLIDNLTVVPVLGYGDVTYNSRRDVLCTISVGGRAAFHLFQVNYNNHSRNNNVKLLKKMKWPSQHGTSSCNFMSPFLSLIF